MTKNKKLTKRDKSDFYQAKKNRKKKTECKKGQTDKINAILIKKSKKLLKKGGIIIFYPSRDLHSCFLSVY